jgi:hypothetical protein
MYEKKPAEMPRSPRLAHPDKHAAALPFFSQFLIFDFFRDFFFFVERMIAQIEDWGERVP